MYNLSFLCLSAQHSHLYSLQTTPSRSCFFQNSTFQNHQRTDGIKPYVVSPKTVPFNSNLTVPDGWRGLIIRLCRLNKTQELRCRESIFRFKFCARHVAFWNVMIISMTQCSQRSTWSDLQIFRWRLFPATGHRHDWELS